MKKNPIETVLGILVVLVAGLFVYYAEQRLSVRPQQGYALTATFLKSGGLESGNDVRINGIKVGSVTGIELTPDYTAKVTIDVKKIRQTAFRHGGGDCFRRADGRNFPAAGAGEIGGSFERRRRDTADARL